MKHNTNESDVKIEPSKIERIVKDQGADNELKQKMKNYYDHYISSISHILSNIDFIKCVINNSDEMQVLFDVAPCFMKNAYINALHMVVIDLCSLFANSSTSFDKFLSFVEQNRDELFTKELYVKGFEFEEDLFDPEEESLDGFKRRKQEDLNSIIENDREMIKRHKANINKVVIVRDKLYAHYDKQMLRKDEREAILKDISIVLLEELANLAEKIFNSIYYYDEFTYLYCKPTNSSDVLGIAHACEKYKKYKKNIISKEHFGKWEIKE